MVSCILHTSGEQFPEPPEIMHVIIILTWVLSPIDTPGNL